MPEKTLRQLEAKQVLLCLGRPEKKCWGADSVYFGTWRLGIEPWTLCGLVGHMYFEVSEINRLEIHKLGHG